MKIINRIFQYLFICGHKNLSFPLGQKKTCLNCGLERKYDWNTQKFIGNWKRYA